MLRRIAGVTRSRSLAAVCAWWFASAPALAAAEQPEFVEFKSDDRRDTPLAGYLYRPAGSGPFPAVIALHGCGGLFSSASPKRLSARHDDWAERLVRQGYVVFFPDSFGSRGVGNVCKTRPRPVSVGRRARDVQGAIAWLARQPFVDRRRLALLGWSHGATSVLLLADRRRPAGAAVRKAVAFYPGCQRFLADRSWRPQIPLIILIGAEDDWTPAEPCRRLARQFPRMIDLVEYPGAFHGFDAPGQPLRLHTGLAFTASGTGEAHTGTEPQARRDAIREVKLQLGHAFARD